MGVNLEPIKIKLSPKDLVEVRKILKDIVPEYPVWAFGSRVRGNEKQYSDLDLVVITTEMLPLSIMADLNNAFDESDLIFRVDIVDWATTSDTFRRIIEAEKVILQAATI